MKIIHTVLLLVCVSISAQSQDLHVYYDAYQDSLHYELEGQVVNRPLLRKGGQIILHVTNYNDYLYELEVTTSEETYDIPPANIGSMLFGGGGPGVMDELKGLLGSGGSIGEMFTGSGGGGGPLGMAGAEQESSVSVEAKEQLAKFSRLMRDVREIEEEISETDQTLQRELDSRKHFAFMQEEVFKLKTNTSLAPKTIKKLSQEYLEKLLDLKPGREVDLDELLKQSDSQGAFGAKLNNHENNIDQLNRKVKEVGGVASLLQAMEIPGEDKENVFEIVERLSTKSTALSENLTSFKTILPSLQDRDLSSLTSLRYLYEEVKDHQFSKRMTIASEADLTTLNIRLVPRDTFANRVSARSFSPIKVSGYGGLKINASVGVSFGSLFDRPQEYLVREGLIFADELDAFSPIITSFVHFYRESKSDVSLAGTMGLGIGIGGESGGSSLQNYFFGPSLLIGKGQRVTITTGLMGAKADRLAQGFQVGDVYDQDIIPLKSVYELGFFFGISFNVLGK